jgi:hypothetical protein
MGLEEFDIAPDNKGGRKKKSEQEDEVQREPIGLSSGEYNSEEYWKSLLEEYWNGEKLTFDAMQSMCHDTHMLPTTICDKFIEFDLLSRRELGEYEDDYTHTPTGTQSVFSSFGAGDDSDDEDYDDSGGLSNIINAAK